MTYEEFSSGVKEMLLDEAEVVNAAAYLDRMIRISLLRVLDHFPAFRPDATYRYTFEEAIPDGSASVVGLPHGSKIREITCVASAGEEGPSRSDPYQHVPWSHKPHMVRGTEYPTNKVYCLSDDGTELYVHPQLTPSCILLVRCESLVTLFKPQELIKVPAAVEPRVVEAAASYVRSRMALDMDKDVRMHREYKVQFKEDVRSIYSEVNDK